jgi:hypothetical protein
MWEAPPWVFDGVALAMALGVVGYGLQTAARRIGRSVAPRRLGRDRP